MKQSYEDFVKELEELWTDENIKDVLDYMGIEYDYIAPVNKGYHVSEKALISSEIYNDKKTYAYKIENNVPETRLEFKTVSFQDNNNVEPRNLKLQAA